MTPVRLEPPVPRSRVNALILSHCAPVENEARAPKNVDHFQRAAPVDRTLIEPLSNKRYNLACVPIAVSDQPAHSGDQSDRSLQVAKDPTFLQTEN